MQDALAYTLPSSGRSFHQMNGFLVDDHVKAKTCQK